MPPIIKMDLSLLLENITRNYKDCEIVINKDGIVLSYNNETLEVSHLITKQCSRNIFDDSINDMVCHGVAKTISLLYNYHSTDWKLKNISGHTIDQENIQADFSKVMNDNIEDLLA